MKKIKARSIIDNGSDIDDYDLNDNTYDKIDKEYNNINTSSIIIKSTCVQRRII